MDYQLRKDLLGISNAKTSKGEDLGYMTGILYLAPSNFVQGINTCGKATAGCRKACLFTAGRGKFKSVETARVNKTKFFRDAQDLFMQSIEASIKTLLVKAKNKNMIPCVRLNGSSDIPWEEIIVRDGKNIFELFPALQFYDYTADIDRHSALGGKWENYHLTFSRKETKLNHKHCEIARTRYGVNIAAVFDKKISDFSEYINGDMHDLRFLDGRQGKYIYLKAKGEAKKDLTGFVIR